MVQEISSGQNPDRWTQWFQYNFVGGRGGTTSFGLESYGTVTSWQFCVFTIATLLQKEKNKACCTLLLALKPEDTALRKAQRTTQTWCVAVAVLGLVNLAHCHPVVVINLQGPEDPNISCPLKQLRGSRATQGMS